MSKIDQKSLTHHARHLRLDTLVRLRWLAIAGQAAAVAGVRFGLGFPLPFALCFLVISASVWVNLLLAIGCATLLVLAHKPLPWYPGQTFTLPFLYVTGIWAAIALGTAFTGIYA